MLCDVTALTLNVRSGPGKSFSSSDFLSNGSTVEPVGISPDGQWIKMKVDGNENGGWVSNSSSFLSCNADVNLLPVVNP
jgi:uncharacterized protein YraI